MKKNIVGIDFGSSSCVVSFINDLGEPEIHTFKDGKKFIPSYVYFDDQSVFFNQEARRKAELHSEDFVSQIKSKFISNKYTHKEYEQRVYEMHLFASELLKYIKKDFEEQHGPMSSVVMTFPIIFEEKEITAFKRAARMANLPIVGYLYESRAAALYYAYKYPELSGMYLVFDVGGEYSDVAVINITRQTDNNIDVELIDSYGADYYGGKDFDNSIFEYMKSVYYQEKDAPLYISINEKLRYLDIAQEIKEKLTTHETVTTLISGSKGELNFTLTRDVFDSLISYSVKMIIELIEEVIYERVPLIKIKGVLYAGGSSTLINFQNYIKTVFKGKVFYIDNPQDSVALGAALACYMAQ